MILFVVILVSFINPFTSSALTTALPSIGNTYGASEAMLSWVIEIFLLACVVSIMPLGKIADRYGKRRIFLGGVALFFISSSAIYFVSSIEELIIIRIFQGLASACVFATNMAIVALVTPKNRRGMAMGLTIAAVYSGLTLGPVLGGLFTYYLSWQAIFYFIAFVCAIDLVIGLHYLKEEWKVPVKKLDLRDCLTYAVAMIAIVFSLTEITTISLAKIWLAGGLLIMAAFLYSEWHKEEPLLPVRLLAHNRIFSCSSLAAMLNYCATFGITFLLSIYLQNILGLNSRDTGLLLLIQPVIMAVLSPVTGYLSDRISPTRLASAGMALITLGLAVLTYMVSHSSLYLIVLAAVIIGLGFSLFTAPNNNAIMSSVEAKDYGAASSIIGTVRLIGQVLSTAVITLLLSHTASNSTALLNTQIQEAFFIFTLLCALGIIPSAVRGKH